MELTNENLKDWDMIYQMKDEYIKKFPADKILKNIKTFVDEDNIHRCSTCGVTEDIRRCLECVNDMRQGTFNN